MTQPSAFVCPQVEKACLLLVVQDSSDADKQGETYQLHNLCFNTYMHMASCRVLQA